MYRIKREQMRNGNYEIIFKDGSKAIRQILFIMPDKENKDKMIINLPELGKNGAFDINTGICTNEAGEYWFKIHLR